MFQHNQQVEVSPSAPHHGGKIGYYNFGGDGLAILSTQPEEDDQPLTLFAVSMSDIILTESNKGAY
jgi:hypothetical protein